MANPNGNPQNFISMADRTPEERREIARKGAEATNKLLRERKTLAEELLILLSQGNVQEKISLAMIEKCLKGDTKAYEVIRDTIGEKPKDKVENLNIETTYEDYINKVVDEDEY